MLLIRKYSAVNSPNVFAVAVSNARKICAVEATAISFNTEPSKKLYIGLRLSRLPESPSTISLQLLRLKVQKTTVTKTAIGSKSIFLLTKLSELISNEFKLIRTPIAKQQRIAAVTKNTNSMLAGFTNF